jgi:hypothetical protein
VEKVTILLRLNAFPARFTGSGFVAMQNHETQSCLLMRSATLLSIAIASSIGWFPCSELRADPGYKSKSGHVS